MEPKNRPGLGDETGRRIDDAAGRGYIEWRWAPAYGVEIVNIEIGNAYRRRGVGRALLTELIARVGGEAKTIFAITRVSNGIARDWYQAMEFFPSGILYGFYEDDFGAPDAILFVKKLKRG